MIDKEMLESAINDIATNEIGVLQSVKGNKGTVIIDNQVYPDLNLLNLIDCQNGLCIPLNWATKIDSQVLVCFIGKNSTEGVVVGVVL